MHSCVSVNRVSLWFNLVISGSLAAIVPTLLPSVQISPRLARQCCPNALLHCADVPICLYMAPFFDDTCARSVNCNMTELLQVTNISISLQKKQLSPKRNNGRGADGFLMFQKVEWTYSHWLKGGGCADGLRPLLRKMSPLMEIRSGYLKDSPLRTALC